MATSMNPVAVGLYNKLTGTSALTSLLAAGPVGVYEDVAPANADCPYVVFNAQSPSVPVYAHSGVKFENAIYQVRGVTNTNSAASAGTIADAIDDALADASLTVSGYTHHYLRRVQNISFPEVGPGGTQYRHRGALYRVI